MSTTLGFSFLMERLTRAGPAVLAFEVKAQVMAVLNEGGVEHDP